MCCVMGILISCGNVKYIVCSVSELLAQFRNLVPAAAAPYHSAPTAEHINQIIYSDIILYIRTIEWDHMFILCYNNIHFEHSIRCIGTITRPKYVIWKQLQPNGCHCWNLKGAGPGKNLWMTSFKGKCWLKSKLIIIY